MPLARTPLARSRPKRTPSLFDTDAPRSTDVLAACGVDLTAPVWPDRFGEQLRHLSQLHRWRPIRTLSLFSGGGELNIGFHDAGFDIREMVEIDDRCAAVLEANTAGGRVFHGATVHPLDVRRFTPNLREKYEFVIGGPPCQSFSAAGRRAEGVAGLNDDRGTLFEEFVRFVPQHM